MENEKEQKRRKEQQQPTEDQLGIRPGDPVAYLNDKKELEFGFAQVEPYQMNETGPWVIFVTGIKTRGCVMLSRVFRDTREVPEKPTCKNNFGRVFELPEEYPNGFCFGGGLPVEFQMVDWFNPWPPDYADPSKLADMEWDEFREKLTGFLLAKNYVKPGRKYLLITDFGAAWTFSREGGSDV